MDIKEMQAHLEKMLSMVPEDTSFWRAMTSWVNNEEDRQFDPEALLAADGIETRGIMSGMAAFRLREDFVTTFGYAVPQPDLIERIAAHGPILEIGAGLGTLSRLLKNIGCDVIATDADPQFMGASAGEAWTEIHKMEASAAVQTHPDRTVLCSWPSYGGTWLTKASQNMRSGQVLIVIGELEGGCTASDCFFDLLRTSFKIAPEVLEGSDVWAFPGINDCARAYRRR